MPSEAAIRALDAHNGPERKEIDLITRRAWRGMTVNGASIYPIVKIAGVLGCSLRDVGQPNMAEPKMPGIGEFPHFKTGMSG